MRGSSRGAYAAGQRALVQAQQSGVDWSVLADNLFAITSVLDRNAALGPAPTAPTRARAAGPHGPVA
jgi:F-type H+-transporting ATPase subunit delta